MNDLANDADKRLDIENVRPESVTGGTVVFAQTYRQTTSGAEISAGEIPVAVAGVYSPTDVHHALATLGFDTETINRALAHELRGPNATKAVSVAEKQAGQVEVLSA